MGRNVEYIRLDITRGCHLGYRTNRVLFVSFRVIFPFAVLMSATKAEVSDLIKANNDQLMASFKELLKDTARQIKRANETSVELQMKEIEELKFQEPHKFKSKANEDQYKFNLKLAETFDSAKSTAEKTNLEKVKSDLIECEKFHVERQKRILHADSTQFKRIAYERIELFSVGCTS